MKARVKKTQHKIVTRDWFSRWSNEYDLTLGKISFHRALLDLMVKNSKVKDRSKILDVGCGTGLSSLKLLEKADCQIIGIDNSREMMAIFQDKIKKLGLKSNITCKLTDVDSMNFGANTFDIVVSSFVLHHLVKKLPVFKKIYKLLKPGGIFIIGEIDMDTTGKYTGAQRLKRILRVLEQEWVLALKEVGAKAFSKLFENGKKHILNDGEYCLSLKQWAGICRKAGFGSTIVKSVPCCKAVGIVVAKKPLN